MKNGKRIGAAALAFALAAAGAVAGLPVGTARVSASDGQKMYRLYNVSSGEHLYTASENEKTTLKERGWRYEGIGWIAPEKTETPVYRLYNPAAGDHHYTKDATEKDGLVKAGWRYEGIGWYSAGTDGIPLYREYNRRAKTGTHNYTTSAEEHNFLVKNGWSDEGIGWYGSAVGYEDDEAKADRVAREKAEKEQQERQAKIRQYAGNALGFFQYVGATDAAGILQNNSLSSYTKIGGAQDATSLANMMKSLDFIDECNRLRAGEGLSALRVTDEMMAISMVQGNASAYTMNHMRAYNVGENLAWGYSSYFGGPFAGWYTEEKKEYQAGNTGAAGHYLNIVNSGYTVTGFATNQYGDYGITHEQSFSGRTSGQSYSVAEYRARLKPFYEAHK